MDAGMVSSPDAGLDSQRPDAESVGQVRRFNRTVTQRIGALDDAFLARDRPLGQARLLWEIGPDGSDVRRAARPARPGLRLPEPADCAAWPATA